MRNEKPLDMESANNAIMKIIDDMVEKGTPIQDVKIRTRMAGEVRAVDYLTMSDYRNDFLQRCLNHWNASNNIAKRSKQKNDSE